MVSSLKVEVINLKTQPRAAAGAPASAAKYAVRFEHPDLKFIVQVPQVERVLELATVQAHHMGVLFIYGDFVETLPPGRYAFWKNMAQVKFVQEDLREATMDVAGQDIMMADKVTLRMNAVVTYRVADTQTAVSTMDDVRQALYREAQLALRAVVEPVSSTRS